MRWEEGGHRVCILDPNNPCINSKASTTFQQTNPVVHQLQHCCDVEPCPRRLIGSLTVLRCFVMLSPSVDAPIAESRKRTELDSLSAWEVARVAMMACSVLSRTSVPFSLSPAFDAGDLGLRRNGKLPASFG